MRPLAVYAAFSAENSVFFASGIDVRRKASVAKATLEFLITKPFQKSKIAPSNIRICANRINDSLKLASRDNLLFQKLIKTFFVQNSCHQPSSATSLLHFVSVVSSKVVFIILDVLDFNCVAVNKLNSLSHRFFFTFRFEFDKPNPCPFDANFPFLSFGFHKILLQLVGFLIPTPQAWHLMYGGTAPHTAHRAKKYPSKTYAHQPHSHLPTMLISSPQPEHRNESLVFKINPPTNLLVNRESL
jgi:hypothetical protein